MSRMWCCIPSSWPDKCPAYSQICFNYQKVGHFAKVCRSKPSRQHVPFTTTEQRTPHTGHCSLSATTDNPTHLTLDNIQHVASSDPAPLVNLDVISANGSCNTKALSDSGADISAAGKTILSTLNEWINTLLPSTVIPKAVNGAKMFSLGRLPVTFRLGSTEYHDDLHIYPDIHGTILSWKACKALRILSPCYPNPMSTPTVHEITLPRTSSNVIVPLTLQQAKLAYPIIFDGQIRSMEGEQFHISLTDDVSHSTSTLLDLYHSRIETIEGRTEPLRIPAYYSTSNCCN